MNEMKLLNNTHCKRFTEMYEHLPKILELNIAEAENIYKSTERKLSLNTAKNY